MRPQVTGLDLELPDALAWKGEGYARTIDRLNHVFGLTLHTVANVELGHVWIVGWSEVHAGFIDHRTIWSSARHVTNCDVRRRSRFLLHDEVVLRFAHKLSVIFGSKLVTVHLDSHDGPVVVVIAGQAQDAVRLRKPVVHRVSQRELSLLISVGRNIVHQRQCGVPSSRETSGQGTTNDSGRSRDL